MEETHVFALRRYVARCRAADDRRPLRELLADILAADDVERWITRIY